MLKTLMRPFLGRGKFPTGLLTELQSEGIEFLEEGMWGTITYLNYRAPGRYSSWRKQAFAGAVALTARRIVACRGSERLLDLPYDHPSIKAVQFKLDGQDCFFASFEVSHFHADRSGKIELRFSTPQASQLLERLQQKGV
jgi:hypothetical protein